MKWYAYKLSTGRIQAKQYSRKTEKEINTLYGSDEVIDVIEDIEARNEKEAIKKAREEFNQDV